MLSLPPPPQKQTCTPPRPPHIILGAATAATKPPSFPATTGNSRLLIPPRRRSPSKAVIWCVALWCILFSVVLILAGIITLVVFLSIKPKHPLFQLTAASLNTVYLDVSDSTPYLNGDFVLAANFSNPNRKISIRYEYVDLELYFLDRMIGTQTVPPFSLRRGEARVELVHMISSQVYLPLNHSLVLRKEVESSRIRYEIKASFRVRAMVGGVTHFSYWLHPRCQLLLSAPPNGVLLARACTTK